MDRPARHTERMWRPLYAQYYLKLSDERVVLEAQAVGRTIATVVAVNGKENARLIADGPTREGERQCVLQAA